jgi:RHS repeat-associated protein
MSGAHNFTYDDAGNLRSVDGGVATYDYDGRNQRVHARRSGEDRYVLSAPDGRLLGEYDATGEWVKEYAYLGTRLIATAARDGLGNEITHFLHPDALGSPTAATDQTGNLLWRETYQPYGERLRKEPAAAANSRWYTGHPQDPETGLVYAGARYYDPVIGRFLSIDPVSYWIVDKNVRDGTMKFYDQLRIYTLGIDLNIAHVTFDNGSLVHGFNRYVYVRNNPFRWQDPTGLDVFFNQNTGELGWGFPGIGVVGTWPATSGPYGNGALPAGDYTAGIPRELPKVPNSPYCDSGGNCWFSPLEPNFPTDRTSLGIHPDGNIPGTEGCVGVKSRNTEDLRDLLKEFPGDIVHVWN